MQKPASPSQSPRLTEMRGRAEAVLANPKATAYSRTEAKKALAKIEWRERSGRMSSLGSPVLRMLKELIAEPLKPDAEEKILRETAREIARGRKPTPRKTR